ARRRHDGGCSDELEECPAIRLFHDSTSAISQGALKGRTVPTRCSHRVSAGSRVCKRRKLSLVDICATIAKHDVGDELVAGRRGSPGRRRRNPRDLRKSAPPGVNSPPP